MPSLIPSTISLIRSRLLGFASVVAATMKPLLSSLSNCRYGKSGANILGLPVFLITPPATGRFSLRFRVNIAPEFFDQTGDRFVQFVKSVSRRVPRKIL